MIRTNRLADDDDFPSKSTIRIAHSLADAADHRARDVIASLLDRDLSPILGAGDRQELLEDLFAERLARQHLLLEGLGLSRVSSAPCIYGPGTWSLTAELDGQRYVFVLSGIRTPHGTVVSARMNARTLYRAASAWRVIAAAAGLDVSAKPSASEWRRWWQGFDYQTSCGQRQRARGIRLHLHDDLVSREMGVRP
jgi:hypothetical protein